MISHSASQQQLSDNFFFLISRRFKEDFLKHNYLFLVFFFPGKYKERGNVDGRKNAQCLSDCVLKKRKKQLIWQA